MALFELARFSSKVEADLARLLLEAEGHQPILFDEGMNHVLGALMPVRLMIAEDEYWDAARMLIDEGLL